MKLRELLVPMSVDGEVDAQVNVVAREYRWQEDPSEWLTDHDWARLRLVWRQASLQFSWAGAFFPLLVGWMGVFIGAAFAWATAAPALVVAGAVEPTVNGWGAWLGQVGVVSCGLGVIWLLAVSRPAVIRARRGVLLKEVHATFEKRRSESDCEGEGVVAGS